MKLYVMGKFEDRENVKMLMQFFRSLGHIITCDWTDHQVTDIGYPVQYSQDDCQGVRDCDVAVGRFIENYHYRGAIAEMGMALVLDKPVWIIGHAIDTMIFAHHPLVRKFDNETQFKYWFTKNMFDSQELGLTYELV